MSSKENPENILLLDRVFLFGDKVSFRIPHEWIESNDGDDCYLYHAPDTDSGWLRVSLNTIKGVHGNLHERLKKAFASKENVRTEKSTGNLISVSEKSSEEDGRAIHLYYWYVGNVIAPDEVCKAIFSYTVLSERVRDLKTMRTVELIGQLVSETRFASGKPTH